MNKKISLFIIIVSIFINFTFVSAQNTEYTYVSKGLDNASTTTISNTSTGGLTETARYIGLMAATAIVTLVIFKLIQGAVLKGTFDNIYDQQKGNKILKNAISSLLIFIFVNLLFSYINPDYGSWIFGVSTKMTVSEQSGNGKNVSGNKCENDPKYISASFLDQIKQDEEDGKFAEKPYMDSLGYPTIGWGFNLDSSNEPKKYLTQVGIKDTQLSNLTSCRKGAEGSKTLIGNCGNEKITKDQADKLLEIELKDHMPAVYKFAGGEEAFNKLPKNIQNVIQNLSYAGDALLTPGNSKYFKKLHDAVTTLPLNYDNIANEIINSTWCTQTKSRCSRIIGLVYNGNCPKKTNSSLYGQQTTGDRSVCGKLSTVDKSKMVDIRTYLKGSAECVERGKNPDICMIDKDVADKLRVLDTAYYNKYKIHLKIVSAYRSDDYQSILCSKTCPPSSGGTSCTADGLRCNKACKSGGSNGSNHSLGVAVDLTSENTGCEKKAKTCTSDKWLDLVKFGKEAGLYNNYSNGGEWGHMSPSGY